MRHLEGRRIEPGFCPQCHHVELREGGVLPLLCSHCQLPLRLIAGKYRVVEQLNEGNYAWIFRALDVTSATLENRAIKIFKAGMLDDVTEKLRFQREVKVTRELSQRSEHIVRIYDDFGYADGLGHYYVMELLEGFSLDELLMDGVPLGASLTFHVVRQLCEALAVVHEAGVVHRDLKPDNIFLIECGEDPNFVKLIDFGIAKRSNTDHRFLTQDIIGTPLYMSPEQCMGKELDRRADMYSLGVLLFCCLTGKIPFLLDDAARLSHRKRMLRLMQAHISSSPLSLCEVRPDLRISKGLNDVVMKALCKDPNERYADVRQFWSALEPFVEDAERAENA